ncbi:hypothetical protein CJ030_MR5G013415 [Morella rubra]|uniref:Uncharacterized protein n=1 Tax=Morella rubra TaxID=262757 RepID=A0A6A1VNQ8_9ROSI|nr:hypothetical protein CJ030_MR5G013415 [Morella rubra]
MLYSSTTPRTWQYLKRTIFRNLLLLPHQPHGFSQVLFPSVYDHGVVTLEHRYEFSSSSPPGYTSCFTPSVDTAYDPISAQDPNIASTAYRAIANSADSTYPAKALSATIAKHSNPLSANTANRHTAAIANTANSTSSSKAYLAAVAKHPSPNMPTMPTFLR